MLESQFESTVRSNLLTRYPGAFVLKIHPNYLQGFPDRLFLYYNFWAAFETKQNKRSSLQPNQQYYVEKLNELSFAKFVHPDNEREFYNEIQQALNSRNRSRVFRT